MVICEKFSKSPLFSFSPHACCRKCERWFEETGAAHRFSIFVLVVSKGCKPGGIAPVSKECGKSQPLRALCLSLSRCRLNRPTSPPIHKRPGRMQPAHSPYPGVQRGLPLYIMNCFQHIPGSCGALHNPCGGAPQQRGPLTLQTQTRPNRLHTHTHPPTQAPYTPALAHTSSLDTDLTRNTRAPHFTPQHWLLWHMGLY